MPPDNKTRFDQPLLTLNHATFRLGDRLIFESTSWTFRRNEQWAVLGPNGSGKSLLGDAVRGMLPLVAGEMTYHFKGIARLSAEECIGHVSFQQRKAELHGTVVQSRWNSMEEHATLTVAQFLSYEHTMGINPFEVRDDQRAKAVFQKRSRRAVKLVGIQKFLDRDLLSLSNGETQRVHLARALSHPLRLLILDEPFIGLDKENRRHFRAVLERLMRTSLKVLLITARPEDLPATITHCLCLNDCSVITAEAMPAIRRPKPAIHPIPPRAAHNAGHSDESGRGQPQSKRLSRSSRLGALTPLVELRNVTIRYGSATILNRINWTIFPGESWALLGPNGSGKTTLLSLILGDNPQAYSNEVIVFGKQRGVGESIWELKQKVGWISPELHLHFDDAITCFEAVASGFHDTIGLFEPLTRRQRLATTQWLERFELGKLPSTPLFALSAGQQRSVLLARALVKQPRLLILDEPCQGLDAEHRDLFIATVDRLIRSGKETAIYVSHRPEEIPSSIHRVLRLRHGRATAQDIR